MGSNVLNLTQRVKEKLSMKKKFHANVISDPLVITNNTFHWSGMHEGGALHPSLENQNHILLFHSRLITAYDL